MSAFSKLRGWDVMGHEMLMIANCAFTYTLELKSNVETVIECLQFYRGRCSDDLDSWQ